MILLKMPCPHCNNTLFCSFPEKMFFGCNCGFYLKIAVAKKYDNQKTLLGVVV